VLCCTAGVGCVADLLALRMGGMPQTVRTRGLGESHTARKAQWAREYRHGVDMVRMNSQSVIAVFSSAPTYGVYRL
jgi:hypothetical protein